MMEYTHTFLLVAQVFVALTLIGFILIQHGKGADAGAAFGSGSSGTVFGSQGSGNFFTKVTTILAVVFLANSLALGYIAASRKPPSSLIDNAELLEQVEKGDITAEQLGKILEKAAQDAKATGEGLDAATDNWDPATTVPSAAESTQTDSISVDAIKESLEDIKQEAEEIKQDVEQQVDDLPALPQ